MAIPSRNLQQIEASRVSGASDARIIPKAILPACIPPLVVLGSFSFANAILYESGLSFLELGAQPPHSSLGSPAGKMVVLLNPLREAKCHPDFEIAVAGIPKALSMLEASRLLSSRPSGTRSRQPVRHSENGLGTGYTLWLASTGRASAALLA